MGNGRVAPLESAALQALFADGRVAPLESAVLQALLLHRRPEPANVTNC
jgi:hypothetical protein